MWTTVQAWGLRGRYVCNDHLTGSHVASTCGVWTAWSGWCLLVRPAVQALDGPYLRVPSRSIPSLLRQASLLPASTDPPLRQLCPSTFCSFIPSSYLVSLLPSNLSSVPRPFHVLPSPTGLYWFSLLGHLEPLELFVLFVKHPLCQTRPFSPELSGVKQQQRFYSLYFKAPTSA